MHCIEPATPFAKSKIWQLQREYYNQAGINAWRTGEVPHYITSNPVMGKTYAELVLALLRDLSLKGQTQDTVYLLELGAGHGRLCFHFLKHFEKYYENSAIPLPPFCYVLSDFTETNLAFWRDHPRLQPYLGKGWLDYALFDAENNSKITLQYSNKEIQPNSLTQPIVVVGNYFFDTIPQDLIKIENGVASNVLVSLFTEVKPRPGLEVKSEVALARERNTHADSSTQIDSLRLNYSYQSIRNSAYSEEPILNTLIDTYKNSLTNSHVLLPHIGLRCIAGLQTLSQQGLVLLTADKGEHHLTNLDGVPAPGLVKHGSFSLTVNYHALQHACTSQGGVALLPRHQQANLDLGCLLYLPNASSYIETNNAYERFVSDYGPDDYFRLKKLIEQTFESADLQDIVAVTRLSGYDARIFVQMLPRLFELLPKIADNDRWNLLLLIPRLWDTYYPLAEANDFANDLGSLLLALEFFGEAVLYFEKSIQIYGTGNSTLYKIALCQCLAGEFSKASPIVERLKNEHPHDETLQALINKYKSELALAPI